VPIAWITFFSSFLLSSFLASPIELPQITHPRFQISLALFIAGGIVFFYFTFFRLKRVDADETYIYVTNYFRTYRYTLDSIDAWILYDHLVFKAVHIVLKEKGKFGKRILFIPKMNHFLPYAEDIGILSELERK
jgi:hypothetical protein